jgi:hypothetical protein
MPTSSAVQAAVKYASKLRRNALTERLAAIGRKKMEEVESEDEEDFETRLTSVITNSVRYVTNGNSSAAAYSGSEDLFAEYDSRGDSSANDTSLSRRKSLTEGSAVLVIWHVNV